MYDSGGDGRSAGVDIVAVHGSMDRAAGWLRVVRRLREQRIVRYDRRGYGRSSGSHARSFEDHVDDLRRVIEYAGGPVVLLAHSYGGVVSLALAGEQSPQVVGVLSYEAPRAWESWWPGPPPDGVDPAEAAEVMMRRLIGDEAYERLPQGTRRERLAEGRTVVDELRWQATQRYDVTTIDIPLVLGVGELSHPNARRAAELGAAEGSAATVAVIPGAGHGAPTSHPAEVATLTMDLLDRV